MKIIASATTIQAALFADFFFASFTLQVIFFHRIGLETNIVKRNIFSA